MPEFLTDAQMAELDKSKGFISDEEMSQMDNGNDKYFRQANDVMSNAGTALAQTVGDVGSAIDRFTGAPVRAAVGAAQDGKSSSRAFLGQFLKPASTAPTGKEIAVKAGVSDKEFDTPLIDNPFTRTKFKASPAGVVGGVGEAVLDPTTYIPGRLAAKGVQRGAEAASRLSPKVAEYLARVAEERAVKAGTGQSVRAMRKIAKINPQSAADVDKAIGNLRTAGRSMLEADEAGPSVVGWMSNAREIGERSAGKRKFFGKQIGEVGKTVDELNPSGVVSGENLKQLISDYRDSVPNAGKGAAIRGSLETQAENIGEMGNLSFKKAQELKNQFPYEPQAADALISSKDATNRMHGIIGGSMDDAVKKTASRGSTHNAQMSVVETPGFDKSQKMYTATARSASGEDIGRVTGFMGPDGKIVITRADVPTEFQKKGIASDLIRELQEKSKSGEVVFDQQRTGAGDALVSSFGKNPLNKYAPAKSKYGLYKDIGQAGTDRAVKDLSNRFVSPSSYGAGGAAAVAAGAATGDLRNAGLYGMLAAGANKVAVERGSAFAAKSADAISKMMATAPDKIAKWTPLLKQAAKRGNEALVTTHHLLMNNDPEYRKIVEGQP